jgi:hypothetical protein
MSEQERLRYPIGKFALPGDSERTEEFFAEALRAIADFPQLLRREVETLNEAQLDSPYRPEGWTVRQVVHHCADSHLNSFTRFKLALTEDNPTIKPYFEERWAELPDAKSAPVEESLRLLEGLHARWTRLLQYLTPPDWEKTFIHPESCRTITLRENLALYAWHCRHHLAHIVELKKRENWR